MHSEFFAEPGVNGAIDRRQIFAAKLLQGATALENGLMSSIIFNNGANNVNVVTKAGAQGLREQTWAAFNAHGLDPRVLNKEDLKAISEG